MKSTFIFLLFVLLGGFISCSSDDSESPEVADDCNNTTSVFTINLDPSECEIDIETLLGIESKYEETLNGTTRNISINGIADHNVGLFPNTGNPNTIAQVSESYSMTTIPSIASAVTSGFGYTTAVLFSGIVVEPYTAEFFEGSNGINRDWNQTVLQTTRDLGLDCNNAHVQPNGRYHYHGTPSAYLENVGNADGSGMIKVGYAADGFPVYYKYAYAADGTTIVELSSGYRLKTTERPGDGSSAPDGCPDGLYFQDYEYLNDLSELDECNGKIGKTPESDNEYFYLITDNFPSVPLCFSGTPDTSFRAGR